MPTLIRNGKQDGLIPPSEAEAAHAAIKVSQLAGLDDCGNKAVDQAFVRAIRAMRFKPGTIDGQLAPFREMHTFILSR